MVSVTSKKHNGFSNKQTNTVVSVTSKQHKGAPRCRVQSRKRPKQSKPEITDVKHKRVVAQYQKVSNNL